uniref:Uncharacterized protein n=1 Tax=Timema genevievae TaxID=629358 RepID=A0A7R9K5A0_TIMGE|nr:unnamed protein product [Timema genevievae]
MDSYNRYQIQAADLAQHAEALFNEILQLCEPFDIYGHGSSLKDMKDEIVEVEFRAVVWVQPSSRAY